MTITADGGVAGGDGPPSGKTSHLECLWEFLALVLFSQKASFNLWSHRSCAWTTYYVPSGAWPARERQSQGWVAALFFLGSTLVPLEAALSSLHLAAVIRKPCAISRLAFHTSQTSACTPPQGLQKTGLISKAGRHLRPELARAAVQGLVRRACLPKRIKESTVG